MIDLELPRSGRAITYQGRTGVVASLPDCEPPMGHQCHQTVVFDDGGRAWLYWKSPSIALVYEYNAQRRAWVVTTRTVTHRTYRTWIH